VENNVKTLFYNNLLQLKANIQMKMTKVSKEFTENIHYTENKYGGDTSLNDYDSWIKSIKGDPRLLKGKLSSIIDIFPPSAKNKSTEINKATEAYLDINYLKGIKHVLTNQISKANEKKIVIQLIERITELQNEKVPNHSKVAKLNDDIDKYLMEPNSKPNYGYHQNFYVLFMCFYILGAINGEIKFYYSKYI
jgi:hypothetical protein